MNAKVKHIINEIDRLVAELKVEASRQEEEKKSEEPGEIFSAEEVVSFFEISYPTLKKYREQGLITPVFPGHRKFYRKKDVIQLMKKLKPKKYADWSC